jgi:hypothetical protein
MYDSVKSSGKVRASCAFTAATYPSSNADPTATASVSHAVSEAEACNDASALCCLLAHEQSCCASFSCLLPFASYSIV